MDAQELKARLERIEKKLDSVAEQLPAVKTDVMWLKGHLKFSFVLVIGVIGKLAQITFFK